MKKNEFLITGSTNPQASVSINTIREGSLMISIWRSQRPRPLLGWFRAFFVSHINKTCWAPFFYFYNIRNIGKFPGYLKKALKPLFTRSNLAGLIVANVYSKDCLTVLQSRSVIKRDFPPK